LIDFWFCVKGRKQKERYIGATPNSQRCKNPTNAPYASRPPTTEMMSLYRLAGNVGMVFAGRLAMEIRSATAQIRKPPKSSTSAQLLLERRWATAHRMVAHNMGCRTPAFIRPGKYVAKSNMNTGNINRWVRCLRPAGGT